MTGLKPEETKQIKGMTLRRDPAREDCFQVVHSDDEVLESILSDEITHVRFANQWLKLMVREDRRLLLKIAMAVRFLTTVTAALAPQEGQLSPIGLPFEAPQNRITQVNVADRRQAD